MKSEKLVCVALSRPYQGRCLHYFGSVAAIYAFIPEDLLGIKYVPLCAALRRGGGCYANKNIAVRLDVVHRAPKKTDKKND